MLSKPLLRQLGINPSQLKTILWTKCTVDDRSPTAVGRFGRAKKSSSSWSTNIVLVIFGIFMAFTVFTTDDPLLAYTIFFTVFIVYVALNLITNFSDVLIDVRDHYLIMSRPVNDRTVSVARILHILIHIGQLVIPLSVPGLILVFVQSGMLAGIVFALEIIAATTISVFCVNIIYLLLLQFMRPEKFRDIIAYFQIALVIIVFMGYNFFPRLINMVKANHISLTNYTISYFLPSVWLAGLQSLTEGIFNQTTYLFSVLAIITPSICLAIVVKFLSRNYNDKMSLMGAASKNATSDENEKGTTKKQQSLANKISHWVTHSPLEQLGFMITWKLTSRMREFKVRVYPSFGFIPIYFIYFVFFTDNDVSLAERWNQLPGTHYYLFILYILIFVSITLLMQVTRSKQYKAAWIYQITSYQKPGHVLSGTLKALIVKFHLPAAVVAMAFILYVWGLDPMLNILLALALMLFSTVFLAQWLVNKFPFSQPIDREEQKGRAFKNILYLLIPAGLGYGQYLISDYTLVVSALTILFGIGTWLLFRQYKNLGWDRLE